MWQGRLTSTQLLRQKVQKIMHVLNRPSTWNVHMKSTYKQKGGNCDLKYTKALNKIPTPAQNKNKKRGNMWPSKQAQIISNSLKIFFFFFFFWRLQRSRASLTSTSQQTKSKKDYCKWSNVKNKTRHLFFHLWDQVRRGFQTYKRKIGEPLLLLIGKHKKNAIPNAGIIAINYGSGGNILPYS